jgi:phage terminase large subunit GpA-like protein
VWKWEKLPGHARNEPLDCRNYALAALAILSPDMDAEARKIKGAAAPVAAPKPAAGNKPARKKRNKYLDGGEW